LRLLPAPLCICLAKEQLDAACDGSPNTVVDSTRQPIAKPPARRGQATASAPSLDALDERALVPTSPLPGDTKQIDAHDRRHLIPPDALGLPDVEAGIDASQGGQRNVMPGFGVEKMLSHGRPNGHASRLSDDFVHAAESHHWRPGLGGQPLERGRRCSKPEQLEKRPRVTHHRSCPNAGGGRAKGTRRSKPLRQLRVWASPRTRVRSHQCGRA